MVSLRMEKAYRVKEIEECRAKVEEQRHEVDSVRRELASAQELVCE